MEPELASFIEHARSKGMDHGTIRMLLISAGWKEKDIVEAMARTTLEVPVPAPPDRGGAREAFMHLLTAAAFYTAVIGVVVLLFHYIDRLLPDPAWHAWNLAFDLSVIRWSLALVLVAYPVYLWLSRLLLREIEAHPERSGSPTRRWLTYLTLLLAALALGGDVVTLVFRLLEGELGGRFLLKVAVVLVLAGLSFAYHFLSLRMPVRAAPTRRMHRTFALVASGLVLGTVAWGFVVAGSPGSERLRKLDLRRIEHLGEIRDALMEHCLGNTRHLAPDRRVLVNPLPANLDVVRTAARARRPEIADPASEAPYGYEVLGATGFRIGARFDLERNEEIQPLWNHPAGWHWFTFDLMRE
jgi:hypothetical protein